ncbi:SH3 domain-containing protein [Streptomyces niveus]|uniref:SH3 domain-containing protein n=1 Tax=Streptomyces niveus TaxID=193462 RepID=UPI002E2F1722|nr:SH3 domain-containing protein [Streptomyces niveus]
MSQRSLRSSAPRLRGSGPYAAALAVAVAALTATPALAAVPTPPPVSWNGHVDTPTEGPAPTDADEATETTGATEVTEAAENEAEAAAAHEYKGRVIARSGLLLRDRPTRSSRVIGTAAYGQIVHIFCKTRGDNVNGNDRWYLLTDGNWAWGSAAYIENIGQAPRWC